MSGYIPYCANCGAKVWQVVTNKTQAWEWKCPNCGIISIVIYPVLEKRGSYENI